MGRLHLNSQRLRKRKFWTMTHLDVCYRSRANNWWIDSDKETGRETRLREYGNKTSNDQPRAWRHRYLSRFFFLFDQNFQKLKTKKTNHFFYFINTRSLRAPSMLLYRNPKYFPPPWFGSDTYSIPFFFFFCSSSILLVSFLLLFSGCCCFNNRNGCVGASSSSIEPSSSTSPNFTLTLVTLGATWNGPTLKIANRFATLGGDKFRFSSYIDLCFTAVDVYIRRWCVRLDRLIRTRKSRSGVSID